MKSCLTTYKKLNAENLDLLGEIYDPEIVFIDPAHEIHGLKKLTDYFSKLYKDINHINFDFYQSIQTNDVGYVQWTMTFSHPSIKKGKDIVVEGATFVQFGNDGKVIHHRDHFDLGSMLYQHVPLLGGVIKSINRRLGT